MNQAIEKSDAEKIVTLFTLLVNAIVENTTRVNVTTVGQSIALTVTPHPDDYGKMVGQRGQTVQSFNALAKVVGERCGKPVHFVLERPPGLGRDANRQRLAPDDKWKPEQILPIIKRTCLMALAQEIKVEFATASRTTTVFSLTVEGDENQELDDALRVIFNAIGKSQGRVVFIDFNRIKQNNGNEKSNLRTRPDDMAGA